MADAADIAQYQQEQMEALMGIGVRAKAWDHLPFIGRCHNCEEGLGSGQKFCDIDCRDDWVKRREALRRR